MRMHGGVGGRNWWEFWQEVRQWRGRWSEGTLETTIHTHRCPFERLTAPPEAGRQEGRQTVRQADRQEGRKAGRQADRQTGRQADRQTGRQADTPGGAGSAYPVRSRKA
ncbi:hypothetical protein BO71DRAFT_396988 [Aspergillus ellipticus CBS 707.79]|uniref:Uncharacterized protein n=1 Tax=Aspergillus ellipticus CBS 707.79 TaxID=1448320 RepID=A0A319DYK8_9EURO|nr:hypothetical protein BO71DRAFT_396988 [Aspergillus ellipticus CBS 707.79]